MYSTVLYPLFTVSVQEPVQSPVSVQRIQNPVLLSQYAHIYHKYWYRGYILLLLLLFLVPSPNICENYYSYCSFLLIFVKKSRRSKGINYRFILQTMKILLNKGSPEDQNVQQGFTRGSKCSAYMF